MGCALRSDGRLGQAFEMAFSAHAGQIDKSGAPYIAHVVRVASRLEAVEDQIVALLHDTVEDCGTSLHEIGQVFGERVAAAVDALTKRDGETLDQYIARVTDDPVAMRVKHADLEDNSDPVRMAQLAPEVQQRLSVKYARAKALLERAEHV